MIMKTNSSLIGCMFAFIRSCFGRPIFQFPNNALQCFERAQFKFPTSNSSKSSSISEETCTNNTDIVNNVEHDEGSFVVSKKDIEVVMEILGMSLDDSNKGDTGGINIGSIEIFGLFEEEEPRMDEVKEAFDVFDQNGDGFIDAKELKRVIGNLGFKEASMEECQKRINRFDEDGDGLINIDEFEKLLENSFSS